MPIKIQLTLLDATIAIFVVVFDEVVVVVALLVVIGHTIFSSGQ